MIAAVGCSCFIDKSCSIIFDLGRNCEKTLETGKQSAILHKDDMILLEEWAAKPTLLYNV